jgi:hypothetical protein
MLVAVPTALLEDHMPFFLAFCGMVQKWKCTTLYFRFRCLLRVPSIIISVFTKLHINGEDRK